MKLKCWRFECGPVQDLARMKKIQMSESFGSQAIYFKWITLSHNYIIFIFQLETNFMILWTSWWPSAENFGRTQTSLFWLTCLLTVQMMRKRYFMMPLHLLSQDLTRQEIVIYSITLMTILSKRFILTSVVLFYE